MGLALKNVSKTVDGEIHLSDIDLEFESGSRNVILGRTLAGKTSLLRLMAGLDRPTRGEIWVDGVNMTGVSVRKRSVAMVYQQFINYPSFTVFDNIASPLKVSNVPGDEIRRRVHQAAEMLHLTDMLDRLPAELSGGQQQRTAIARALVKDAHLLLLDEPLVNLDYKLREELQEELQEIFRAREAIVVYTTTEPGEALKLGGNIVVMDEGRILQAGRTTEVYRNPMLTKVAEVFSDPPINYMKGVVSGGVATLESRLEVLLTGHLEGLDDGRYLFGVRSNHLFLNRQSESDAELTCRVSLAEINGSETFVHVNYGDTRLVVQEVGIHSKKIGSDLSVYVSPSRLFAYSDQGSLLRAPAMEG